MGQKMHAEAKRGPFSKLSTYPWPVEVLLLRVGYKHFRTFKNYVCSEKESLQANQYIFLENSSK